MYNILINHFEIHVIIIFCIDIGRNIGVFGRYDCTCDKD